MEARKRLATSWGNPAGTMAIFRFPQVPLQAQAIWRARVVVLRRDARPAIHQSLRLEIPASHAQEVKHDWRVAKIPSEIAGQSGLEFVEQPGGFSSLIVILVGPSNLSLFPIRSVAAAFRRGFQSHAISSGDILVVFTLLRGCRGVSAGHDAIAKAQ